MILDIHRAFVAAGADVAASGTTVTAAEVTSAFEPAFLFTPELAGVVRPALPALVVMIYAMAMTRIDLPTVLRRALRPRRFAMLAGVSLLMLVATPPVYLWIGQALGAGPGLLRALVYTGAAPPIASSPEQKNLAPGSSRLRRISPQTWPSTSPS